MKNTIAKWLTKTYFFLREIRHSILISFFGFSFTCKHETSCSRNLLECIKRKGVLRGSASGLRRMITCVGSARDSN